MDNATATPAAERGTGDYVQCAGCKDLHWESDRVDASLMRVPTVLESRCARCGAAAYFVRQAPR